VDVDILGVIIGAIIPTVAILLTIYMLRKVGG